MNKGKVLTRGSTIGLVAPSSPATKQELEQAITGLEKEGFKVVPGKSCTEVYGGYLSGRPSVRAEDIHHMFASENIDGIMCLRGGYGTSQLLSILNFDLIKQHPKVFVGFSDITALHIAFLQNAELVTFHGPTMSRGLHRLPDISKQYLLRSIMSGAPIGEVVNESEHSSIQSLTSGIAHGQLVGGNLSLISATMGTPYEIDTENKILFIEEVGEDPYRIDRMLTQLMLAGKLSAAKGIILGTWHQCEPKDKEGYFSVEDLFYEIIKPLNKPTIYNVQSGHGPVNITLPLGVNVVVDANKGRLFIDEVAVRE